MQTFICVNDHKLTIVFEKKSPRPPFCLSCKGSWANVS